MAYTHEHCLRSRQDFPALVKSPVPSSPDASAVAR